MLAHNTEYEIKTPNGYETFSGIQKLENRKTVCLVLDNGVSIDVTLNHKVKTPLGFIEITRLYEGDVIITESGPQKIVRVIANIQNEDVYDILDAGKDNCYYTNGILSHNCEFIGSTNTLIHPAKLRSLVFKNPIRSEGKLDIYEDPVPDHTYVMTVDVSEGQNLDYSAYSMIDVTEIPYRQVAKFKDNTVQPFLLPTLIYTTARKYNDAFVLVEINSIGLQVSDILHFELAYENIVKIELRGRQGQQFSPGFKKRIGYGLKQSVQTKKIGCANLKTLVESDKLIINDSDTIMELTTFSADKQSFKAEDGNNDDLAMTLVNFGWLTSQRYFKENIKNDIRIALQEEQLKIMDADISPFIIDDGMDEGLDLDKEKDLWVVDRQSRYVFDNITWETLSNKHKL